MRSIVQIFIFSLLFSLTLFSQRGPKLDERMEVLTEELSLTDQQQKDIKVILTDTQKKMREIRDEYKGDREEMREHIGPIRKETNDKILKLLNPDQQKAYKEYLREQREKNQRNREQNSGQ